MANLNENISITDSQNSITESLIMSEGVHSTPVTNKKTDDNDMIKIMQMLLNEKFNKLDMKFDEPVSYTHLDVYKRQTEHCVITEIYESFI